MFTSRRLAHAARLFAPCATVSVVPDCIMKKGRAGFFRQRSVTCRDPYLLSVLDDGTPPSLLDAEMASAGSEERADEWPMGGAC